MNECDKFRLMISRLIDDDLSEAEKTALATHMKSCKECADLCRAFLTVSDNIPDDSVEPPEELAINVMAEIRRIEIKRRSRKAWSRILTAAACIAFIIISGYSFLPRLMNSANAKMSAASTYSTTESAALCVEPPALASLSPYVDADNSPAEAADNEPTACNEESTAAMVCEAVPSDVLEDKQEFIIYNSQEEPETEIISLSTQSEIDAVLLFCDKATSIDSLPDQTYDRILSVEWYESSITFFISGDTVYFLKDDASFISDYNTEYFLSFLY